MATWQRLPHSDRQAEPWLERTTQRRKKNPTAIGRYRYWLDEESGVEWGAAQGVAGLASPAETAAIHDYDIETRALQFLNESGMVRWNL